MKIRKVTELIQQARFDSQEGSQTSVSVRPRSDAARDCCRRVGYVYRIDHYRRGTVIGRYIGETGTTLPERIKSHRQQAKSRHNQGKYLNERGLFAAIVKDPNPTQNFKIELLRAVQGSPEARHAVEAEELAKLAARQNAGKIYNIAANGGYHSGGSGNKQPCVLRIDGRKINYSSFSALIRDVAESLGEEPVRFSDAVRMRYYTYGWTWPEALGLAPRVDGRRTEASLVRNRVAAECGAKVATIKSRQVRERQRRQQSRNSVASAFMKRGSEKRAALLAAATEAGVPVSTALYRLDRIRRGALAASSELDVISACTAPVRDRRSLVRIELPGGEIQERGINEWAKFAAARPDGQLSFSGVKRRLHALRASGGAIQNQDWLTALGVALDTAGRRAKTDVSAGVTEQPRQCGLPGAQHVRRSEARRKF